VKVAKINIKVMNNNWFLTAIQFVYSNGKRTPLFDRYEMNDNFKKKCIKIDTTRQVRQIGVKISEDQGILGLRLIDAFGENITDVTWSKKDNYSGNWMT